MVRISDILKRGHDEEEPRKEKDQGDGVKEITEKDEIAKKEKPQPAPIEIARVMMEKTKLGQPPAKETYQELINLTKDIFAKAGKNEPIEGNAILEKIDKLVNQMALASEELIALTTNSSEDNYLYAHSVNVCILSLAIGFGLGYNKSKLNELAFGAFLHDIGMVKIIDLVQQPRQLKKEEKDPIKQHPVYGVEILEKSSDLSKEIIYIIGQEHERLDGSGYPKGIDDDNINEYARIVGLVDTYEAITHPRPYKNKLMPYEAMKKIIDDKSKFDPKFLKALIMQLGIYSLGSLVQLNTDEIAEVAKINRGLPLRPLVNVIYDPEGNKLERPKSIDLAKQSTLYIKKPVEESKLEEKLSQK